MLICRDWFVYSWGVSARPVLLSKVLPQLIFHLQHLVKVKVADNLSLFDSFCLILSILKIAFSKLARRRSVDSITVFVIIKRRNLQMSDHKYLNINLCTINNENKHAFNFI